MSSNYTSRITYLLDAAQAQAEASKTEKSFRGIEKAAQSAGVSGAAGLTNLEKTTGGVLLRQQQLAQSMSQVEAAIKAEAASLDLMQRVSVRSADAQGLLSGKIKDTEQNLIELLVQKQALGAQSEVLSNALENTGNKFNQLTTRVNVGKGILTGYDAALEGVLRATGGINLGWAVGIGLASTLLPKIIELATAKSKIVEIDEKQVALDVVSAQLSGNQSRVNADLITSFRNIAIESKSYSENQKQLNKDIDDLINKGRSTVYNFDSAGRSIEVTARSTKQLQEHAASLNVTLGEQDKRLQPAIESLRIIRQAYGLNEEGLINLGVRLHAFGTTQEEIARNQTFFKEQLEADLPALRELANELDKGAAKASDFERNILAAYNAVRLLEKPKVNFDFLRGLSQDPNERIKAALDAAIGGFTNGPPSESEMFGAVKPQLEAIRKEFRANAADIAHNQAEAVALYETYIGKLEPMYQMWIKRLDAGDHNMKAFSDSTKQAEAAARSLDSFISQLQQRADNAAAKTGDDSFEKQVAMVKAESAKLYRDLAAMRDQDVAKRNLAADLIKLVEVRSLAEIQHKRVEALQDAEDRLSQIRAKGVLDEVERHRQEIEVKLREDYDYLRKLGFSEEESKEKLIRFREAREEEYYRWLNDENNKFMAKAIEAERKLAGDIYKIREKLLADVQKSNALWWKQQNRFEIERMKEVEQLRKQLLSRILPGSLTHEQTFAINLKIEGSLDKLKDIGIAARDVDKYFGSASQSVEQFNRRVNILAGDSVSFIDVLSELINKEALLRSGIEAFTSAISGAIAGTENLGRALLVSFFQIVGQIAIQLGTLFVLAAAGFTFIPGLNWSAGALAAAGVAMLAFGAVMTGLASKFSQQNNNHAATNGNAAASVAGNSSPNREPRNNTIAFPTSGSASNGPIMVTLKLDRSAAKDLFDGKEVVTMHDLRGGGRRSSEVQRRIKKLAS